MALATIQYASAALSRTTTFRAFLPTDGLMGPPPEPPYRTVYVLPGYSLDAVSVSSFLPLRRECELKGLAVVVVDGCNSFYVDHPERGENYATFAGREIVDFTRRILPLSDRREDTYIAGISMGGYGALHTALAYPDTFGAVIALSSALVIHNIMYFYINLCCFMPKGRMNGRRKTLRKRVRRTDINMNACACSGRATMAQAFSVDRYLTIRTLPLKAAHSIELL